MNHVSFSYYSAGRIKITSHGKTDSEMSMYFNRHPVYGIKAKDASFKILVILNVIYCFKIFVIIK